MATAKPRIFVSHSSKDQDFCLQLVNDLQAVLGDESAVWYDARGGLHGGDTWWHKIMQELKARDVFIVVLSPDAVVSPWVNSEIDLAWRQKHSPSGKLIIPLLYRTCEVRDDLDILQIISFLSPKSYEVALEELLLALGLTPKKGRNQLDTNIAPRITKDQWVNEGVALLDLKRYEEAIAPYDQAIRLDPNKANAYFNKGNALLDLKRYEEAIAAYDQAIGLDPNYATAYYNKGLALYNLKRSEEAIVAYDQAIHLDPNYALAYNNKGTALYNLKRYEEAIAAFDQAIGLDPNYALAYYNKGNTLEALKKSNEARQAYEKAKQLGYWGL